jgi:RNA polymerase sigma-70 factor, ECF subfamily
MYLVNMKRMDIEKDFLEAYNTLSNALFRHAYMKLHDKDAAKDMVQETFTKTWLYIAKGNEIEYMKSFLYRTLHNNIVDFVRKSRTLSLDTLEDDGMQFPQETSLTIPERSEYNELIGKIKQLKEPHHTILIMRYVDDLPPKDIAEALRISANSVSVRIHRALQALRKCYPQENLLS